MGIRLIRSKKADRASVGGSVDDDRERSVLLPLCARTAEAVGESHAIRFIDDYGLDRVLRARGDHCASDDHKHQAPWKFSLLLQPVRSVTISKRTQRRTQERTETRVSIGRGDKIRTCDPLHPMQAPALIGNSIQATRISFLKEEFAFGNASASIKPRFSESI
jgi:hypothetical protein